MGTKMKYIISATTEKETVSIVPEHILLRHHLLLGIFFIVTLYLGTSWALPAFIGASTSSIILFFRNKIDHDRKCTIEEAAGVVAMIIRDSRPTKATMIKKEEKNEDS